MRLKKLRITVAIALAAAFLSVVIIFTKGTLEKVASVVEEEKTYISNNTNTPPRNTNTQINRNTSVPRNTNVTNNVTNTAPIIKQPIRTRAS